MLTDELEGGARERNDVQVQNFELQFSQWGITNCLRYMTDWGSGQRWGKQSKRGRSRPASSLETGPMEAWARSEPCIHPSILLMTVVCLALVTAQATD